LDDPELDRRAHAVNMVLFMGTHCPRSAEEINPWCISVAFRDLLKALDAFQLNRAPLPAEFPTAKELITIAHSGGRNQGLEEINKYLSDKGVTA
jgi:hypothetical protein